MKTNRKTVADAMKGHKDLTLVRWDSGSNHLTLTRQADGRIDLVDGNCHDTGTDCSGWAMGRLMAEVKNWLRCVEADEIETRMGLEQATSAISNQ